VVTVPPLNGQSVDRLGDDVRLNQSLREKKTLEEVVTRVKRQKTQLPHRYECKPAVMMD
jgi:hypothetical protein